MLDLNALIPSSLVLYVTKAFFLVCIALFVLFLLVVLRQVQSMNRIIFDSHDAIILRLIAFALLMGGVSLFFFALVIL